MTRSRRVSSGTYVGLSPEARAGLHASEHTPPLLEALSAYHATVGVELTGESLRGVRALLAAARRESYLAGTELETEYRTALEAATAIRDRLEALLRAHGIRVPTERLPSEPP